jgi:Reverse transcriptase (RNA-dependent DNA polymerase)
MSTQKGLYGLKESARWWYDTTIPVLKKLGFEHLEVDLCVFKHEKLGSLLILYVDDMRIAAPTNADIDNVQRLLSRYFKLHDCEGATI